MRWELTLTKNQIAETLIKRIGFSKVKSNELVENLIEIIKRDLGNGEDVLITNFGKFKVKDKNVRKGRNPATGEILELPARRVVTFKASTSLRDKINGKKI